LRLCLNFLLRIKAGKIDFGRFCILLTHHPEISLMAGIISTFSFWKKGGSGFSYLSGG
jgi:hypothetical protein